MGMARCAGLWVVALLIAIAAGCARGPTYLTPDMRKPIDRTPPPAPPGLLPEGFAPPDEAPAPPEFEAAVAAYRAKNFAEALRLLDALAARGDGVLLPPEARLDRAIVLGAMCRREEARRIALRVGDARIADAPDRALEAIALRR